MPDNDSEVCDSTVPYSLSLSGTVPHSLSLSGTRYHCPALFHTCYHIQHPNNKIIHCLISFFINLVLSYYDNIFHFTFSNYNEDAIENCGSEMKKRKTNKVPSPIIIVLDADSSGGRKRPRWVTWHRHIKMVGRRGSGRTWGDVALLPRHRNRVKWT